MASLSRCKQIADIAATHGVDEAAKRLGLKRETVRREIRRATSKGQGVAADVDNSDLAKIAARYSKAELRALANGGMESAPVGRSLLEVASDHVTVGIVGDTHFGSKYTNLDLWHQALDTFAAHSVDAIFHAGDVCEGLSNRPGHVYECTHIGYEAQRDHAIEMLSEWTDSPIYMIDGNHDRWFTQAVGAHVVKDICATVDNCEFIGHDEGDIDLGPVRVKLWHGGDGSSYATSYRLQKIIESFTGGEKPHVLLAGHAHKTCYIYDRHVHCLSVGAIQSQSKWMRGKRLASHTGYWLAEIGIGESGVASFTPTWYPAYC